MNYSCLMHWGSTEIWIGVVPFRVYALGPAASPLLQVYLDLHFLMLSSTS
jgi:hypothetical protein